MTFFEFTCVAQWNLSFPIPHNFAMNLIEMYRRILFYLLPFLVFSAVSCSRSSVPARRCRTLPIQHTTKDLLNVSPDHRLNVFLTPDILMVNGAPVGRLENGRFTDYQGGQLYAPLMEAIIEEFGRHKLDPYMEIMVYVDKRIPPSLAKLVVQTAERASLASVFVLPYDFSPSSCSYVKPKPSDRHRRVMKIPGTVLVRLDKDAIYVDGKAVVRFKYGLVPPQDMDGMIIVPLFKKLVEAKKRLSQDAVPVFHVSVDSDPKVVKMILFTAGKAGFGVMRTFRVLP